MSLSLPQLAAHAAKALRQAGEPATVAYAWPHGWNGGDTITLDGRELPLHHCGSALELRAVLGTGAESSRVLLVSVAEKSLGQDVLGRLFRHRLLHVDRWQLVQDAYEVHQIDPRLFALGWMPELLLASATSRRPSPATVLTYDEAIETCVSPVLGISPGQFDLESLLLACEHSGPRWIDLGAEPRELFRHYLVARLGSLAAALLAAMEAGSGHAVLGMGLVCEVLYAPVATQTQELRDARVRLEQRLNGLRLKEADGKQWAELAKHLLDQRIATSRQHDFRLAGELLDAVGASEFVGISSVLPESLDSRLRVLGEAITHFLRSPDALRQVEAAAEQVLAHQFPPGDHPGPECARMVARLCRYEATVGLSGLEGPDLVKDYLHNGAWEDWARRVLRGARPEALARAVTKLLDRVATRRMASDEAFSSVLARTAEIGDFPAHVLPIESTLDTIVTPLAQHAPVLMLVMDGMSQDVYLAIAESMAGRGWNSWSSSGLPPVLLATTPSVTECSRASLLAGRLTRGVAHQERQAFAQHEGLRRVSRAAKPPLLLHKAGLEQSHQLSVEAAHAIADPEQRVVGVVINAIDDALAKSDQVRIDWTMESIPLLAEALEHARRAGRTVVLTSDHGHVLERQSTLHADGEGERWRRPGRTLDSGEILISGPRVTALMGASLIAPWSENIRYAAKKNGYHGGVSRQEMLVPFGIWTVGPQPESDKMEFVAFYSTAPAWWNSTGEVAATPIVQSASRRSRVTPPVEDLFSMPPVDDWLERLMASPLLARQRERAGRMALEPERLRALLGGLQQHGGRCSVEQLASAIAQPVMRMRGVIAAMERMLNLDGFPIITLEQGSSTVLLDIPLLKTQFLS